MQTNGRLAQGIAIWLITDGTSSTTDGSWGAGFFEIADLFDVPESEIRDAAPDILTLLETNEAVASVNIHADEIGIVFCAACCKNLEKEAYICMFPYLDQSLDISHEKASQLHEILKTIYDFEYSDESRRPINAYTYEHMDWRMKEYICEIEKSGTLLETACGSSVLWAVFRKNAFCYFGTRL